MDYEKEFDGLFLNIKKGFRQGNINMFLINQQKLSALFTRRIQDMINMKADQPKEINFNVDDKTLATLEDFNKNFEKYKGLSIDKK